MDLGESVSKQKKRISTFITADLANELFNLDIPYIISLPFNPVFDQYLEHKGINKNDVFSVAQNYVLPGKLYLQRLARNMVTNNILSSLFGIHNPDSIYGTDDGSKKLFVPIRSKGEQQRFIARNVLDRATMDEIRASEKQMVDLGVITQKESITRHMSRLKNHFKPGAKKSDKIQWIDNAMPKGGCIIPFYEVDLEMATIDSRINQDLLYVQMKGKSTLSWKSKTIREMHKKGFPIDIETDEFKSLSPMRQYVHWLWIERELAKAIKDTNGVMMVGKSEPYTTAKSSSKLHNAQSYGLPNSTLSYLSANLNLVPGLNVRSFSDYYDPKVREKKGTDIRAHHYTIAAEAGAMAGLVDPEQLPLEAQVVLSYTDMDFYQPMSFHVKSMRNEIEDTFGPRAHNMYKYNSLIEGYKAKLSKKELHKFNQIDGELTTNLVPDVFTDKVSVK